MRTREFRILGPMSAADFVKGLGERRWGEVTDACASLDYWFSLTDRQAVVAHFGAEVWELLQRLDRERRPVDEDATPTDLRIARPQQEPTRLIASQAAASPAAPLPRPKPLSAPVESTLWSAWFLKGTLFVLGIAMSAVVYLLFRILRQTN